MGKTEKKETHKGTVETEEKDEDAQTNTQPCEEETQEYGEETAYTEH